MKYNKSFAQILILVIVLGALAIGGVVYFAGKSSAPKNDNNYFSPTTNNNPPDQQQPLSQSNCGLTINSPVASSSVPFPLVVTGTIDNNNSQSLGCSWTMFEGQAGTAQLYSWSGTWNAVGSYIVVPVSNWMTTGPVSFSITIPSAGLSSGTQVKINFTEENPSGNPPIDTLDLPLVVQ